MPGQAPPPGFFKKKKAEAAAALDLPGGDGGRRPTSAPLPSKEVAPETSESLSHKTMARPTQRTGKNGKKRRPPSKRVAAVLVNDALVDMEGSMTTTTTHKQKRPLPTQPKMEELPAPAPTVLVPVAEKEAPPAQVPMTTNPAPASNQVGDLLATECLVLKCPYWLNSL
jgi:hypothetical protein